MFAVEIIKNVTLMLASSTVSKVLGDVVKHQVNNVYSHPMSKKEHVAVGVGTAFLIWGATSMVTKAISNDIEDVEAAFAELKDSRPDIQWFSTSESKNVVDTNDA